MPSVGNFIDRAIHAHLLDNTDVRKAIEKNVDSTHLISDSLDKILTNALGEMDRREIGVNTAAAIIIGAINSSSRPNK